MTMPELDTEFATFTDAELVAEARKGNRAAFDVLIGRHRRQCVDFAAFILRDRGAAQDEVQQACCKAFEHLDQYQGDAEFIAWLLRIVSNQCLMLIRDRRRARFVYIDADTDRERRMPIQLPSKGEDPERQLINRQILEVFHREIRRIPPLLRNVLVLRDLKAMPMRDVAQQLNITVPAAKSRLLRARMELKDRMMKRCGPPRIHAAGPAPRAQAS
jgi:RNA polymerase sigma-70 factor (ECF subfamily)